MARIVLSALVSDLRGKIGGSVVQQGQYGLIIKGNKWRCNSQYKKIGDWKIKTGNVFHLWKRLSPAEKEAWKTAANAVVLHRPDGTAYKLSGYMQFTKTNLPLAFADQPLLPTPDGPAPVVYVQNVSTDSVWNSMSSFEMSMQFDQINPAQILSMDILATSGLPIGTTPNANQFSYIGTYNPAGSPLDFTNDWQGTFNEWPYGTAVWLQYVFSLADSAESTQTVTQNIVATHDPLVPPYLDITPDNTNYVSPSDFSLQTSVSRYDETFNYTVNYYLSAGVDAAAPRPPADCRFIGSFQGDVTQHQFPDLWKNEFGSWPVDTIIYGYALVSPIGVGGPTQTIDLLFTQ